MRRRSADRVVAMSPAGSRLRLRASLLPVAAGCVAVIPLLRGLSPAAAGVGAVIAIWVVLVNGYTVTYGFAGQFSVGHAALWGVGAYATAILMSRFGWSFWSAIPVAVIAGCLAGAVFGLPAWRLRGDYIALVTLAGGIIVQQIMLNWGVTGGADGIANVPPVTIGDRPLDDTGYYVLLGAIAFLCTAFTSYLKHSAIGLSWRAVKDDELAAEASGIRVPARRSSGLWSAAGSPGSPVPFTPSSTVSSVRCPSASISRCWSSSWCCSVASAASGEARWPRPC